MSLLQSRNPLPTRSYYNNTGSWKPFKEAAHPSDPHKYKAHTRYLTSFPQTCHGSILLRLEQGKYSLEFYLDRVMLPEQT